MLDAKIAMIIPSVNFDYHEKWLLNYQAGCSLFRLKRWGLVTGREVEGGDESGGCSDRAV
jgi:hypothetical protein